MLNPGTSFGHYQVLELIGSGGMGEVYRARDTQLGRDVALKVLSERVALDAHRHERFEREARVLASLNHPNIAGVHGIELAGGVRALILEFVPGHTLADRLEHGPLPLREALVISQQIAAALEAAHERGVVHRDLKPGNVQLRPDGVVKLLDFGLAKVFAPAPGDSDGGVTLTAVTAGAPAILGTPAYMSPEQARGLPVDRRTDVWAFGCVLYELLCGRRAFTGSQVSEVIANVIERDPDFDALPEGVPPGLRKLLQRCLTKDPQRRLRDIGDVRLEIEEFLAATGAVPASSPVRSRLSPATRRYGRSVRAAAVVISLFVALSAGVGLYWFWDRDQRWLAEYAIPQIEKHLDVADWESAYALAKQADARVPDSAELDELWTRITWRVTIPSDPPGATVYRQAYLATGDAWEVLGQTPLRDIRIPYGLSRLRFELPGYRPMFRAIGGGHLNWEELTPETSPPDNLLVGPDSYRLDTERTLPAGKVRVPGWTLMPGNGGALKLDDFFIGRYEVTNAEYKEFVSAGGYARSEFWDPIIIKGARIPFATAVSRFTDRTGRPGPSTWEAGDYPEGRDAFPVSGVSWYEAAAYARFRREELPTAHHWQQALAVSMFHWQLDLSNFSREGPRSTGESRAMSHVGAFDMTGNVREWTATALGEERIILGGSWNDPYYIAGTADTSAPPLDRSEGNGIRLAIAHDPPEIAARVRAPMMARTTASPELTREPVADVIYGAYARIFDYGRGALNTSVLDVRTTRVWTRERIEIDAGYGSERLRLHLYLPNGGNRPYQTVVYWPGWDTFGLDNIDQYVAKQVDFIVKSGRAVVLPVFKGTFDRRVANVRVRPPFNTTAWRDNAIDTVKDLRRTVDYLQTRTDIDQQSLSLFGYSWGGVNGPIALAVEPRLRLGVVYIGLLPPMAAIPEVDPLHALPRVHVPVLMFSGEFDAMVPLANARRYFDLIGVSAARKRHVVAVGGHYVPRDLLIRETLDWLDRHLGPAGATLLGARRAKSSLGPVSHARPRRHVDIGAASAERRIGAR